MSNPEQETPSASSYSPELQLSIATSQAANRITNLAEVLTADTTTEETHATLGREIDQFTSYNLVDCNDLVKYCVTALLRLDSDKAPSYIHALVDAVPKTPTKLDLLTELAMLDGRFADEAGLLGQWHRDKIALVKSQLEPQYIEDLYGTPRKVLNLPNGPLRRPSTASCQPIAAAVVDHIPLNEVTSAIESSLAYLAPSLFGGTIYGNVLTAARLLLNDPRFEFADNPQFGFSAHATDGENSYLVTVADDNLPAQHIVIDLSAQPFAYSSAYDPPRFLCHIIQTEKNRKQGG